MTIYCCPPPVFFLMEFIFKFFDMEIALVAFDAIRCYPFFKFARRARRKVQLCPHTGLQIFPDCAVIFPARCSVCTALILRNEHVCLFEGAFRNLIYGRSHLTPQNFQEICACFLACLKSQIWDASSKQNILSLYFPDLSQAFTLNLTCPSAQSASLSPVPFMKVVCVAPISATSMHSTPQV